MRDKCQHKQGAGTNDPAQEAEEIAPPLLADVLIYGAGLDLHTLWELANGNCYLAQEQESAKKVIVNIPHP